jgi:hypothetical protein
MCNAGSNLGAIPIAASFYAAPGRGVNSAVCAPPGASGDLAGGSFSERCRPEQGLAAGKCRLTRNFARENKPPS